MSIKIKTLKRFLLLSVCFVFAGVNYLSYVQADTASAPTDTTQDTTPGLTDTVSANFQKYLASKKGQTITLKDLNSFSAKEVASTVGNKNVYATFDDLPQVDKSEIKVLSQKYSNLSSEKKQEQIKNDDSAYMAKIGYLIFSNLPTSVLSTADLLTIKDDFFKNLTGLSGTDNAASVSYFINLGNKMDLILSQTKDMEVPENMVDVYTKAMRLTKGLHTLKDDGKNFQDPISQVIMLKKVTNLSSLFRTYASEDIMPFIKSNPHLLK